MRTLTARTREYEAMMAAYRRAEGDPRVFRQEDVAHLVIHENRVIGANLVPGLVIEPDETGEGVNLMLRVLPGVVIERPVHLCFGVLPAEGLQIIGIDASIGEAAGVSLLAHCVFPNAVRVEHRMQARITVERAARYRYHEAHFHGEEGGAVVVPRSRFRLGENAFMETSFQLASGRVGRLEIDFAADAAAGAVAEMTARVSGYGDDRISIGERCALVGEGSRGLIKSRVAVAGRAVSEVTSEISARGKGARGHVDCIEIVQDQAVARAVPIVDVLEDTAKVTHEAAIGSVDRKQLETLMARGLSREQATDVIIRGMLGTG